MIGLGLGDEIGGGQFWGAGIGLRRGWGSWRSKSVALEAFAL